jgi:hypothetical protein
MRALRHVGRVVSDKPLLVNAIFLNLPTVLVGQ